MATITIEVPDGYLCEAVVDGKVYQAPPDKMPNAAKLYVWEYGFQRCNNDRTGGKDKSPDDKRKIVTAMIARLTSPDFTERVSHATDPVLPFVRSIIRLTWKAAGGKGGKYESQWKAYSAKGMDSDMRNKMLDEAILKQDKATLEALYKQASADRAASIADAERRLNAAKSLVAKHELKM